MYWAGGVNPVHNEMDKSVYIMGIYKFEGCISKLGELKRKQITSSYKGRLINLRKMSHIVKAL